MLHAGAGLRALPVALLLIAPIPTVGRTPASEPYVGEIIGDLSGSEGDALAFTVFLYGFDTPPNVSWDFGDGKGNVSGAGLARTSHEYLKGKKTYTVTARIGGTTRTLDVEIANGAPVIEFLQMEPDPQLQRPVKFRARATDPGDDALKWTWDYGDGSPPQNGTNLGAVSHKYARSGHYIVRLSVADEETTTSQTLHVYVGVDLVAVVQGAINDTIQGTSGAANFLAGSIVAAAPIPRVSVGRTNDFCMVAMGFWDDLRKVHVNFLWTPEPKRLFHPGDYPIVDSRKVKPQANQAQVQFHWMSMGTSYADAKGQAASGAGETSNRAAILGRILGNMLSLQQDAKAGGDNWMMYSRGGVMHINYASADRIRGTFVTHVDGVSIQSRNQIAIDMVGQFTFRPVSAQTGPALQQCAGNRKFTVEEHTPKRNERFVNFLSPNIAIGFARPYRPSTVTDKTVLFGFMDTSGKFQQLDAKITLDNDGQHVQVTPSAPLKTMMYYRVRIEGGPDGVLGDGGEQLPDNVYEWRFATSARSVPGARGGR